MNVVHIMISMNYWSPRIQSASCTFTITGNNTAFRLPWDINCRFMSKYLSKAAKKRLPLTTKQARKGFYKGKGGTKEGRLTSKGRFLVDPLKRLQLIIPDLTGFKVGRSSQRPSPTHTFSNVSFFIHTLAKTLYWCFCLSLSSN
jgi:Mitochondrial ribosomal protein L27